MQIGAHRIAETHAIVLPLVVVAPPRRRRHLPERFHARTQVGAARMVLVAHHGQACQGGMQNDVANEAVGRRAGATSLDVDQSQALHCFVAQKPRAAQNLIAAADGQKNAIGFHEEAQVVLHAHEFFGSQSLLAVGAAAHERQIDVGQVHGITAAHTLHLHRNVPPAAALLQNAHVAAIAVQVEQVGEQVRYHQRRGGGSGGKICGRGSRGGRNSGGVQGGCSGNSRSGMRFEGNRSKRPDLGRIRNRNAFPVISVQRGSSARHAVNGLRCAPLPFRSFHAPQVCMHGWERRVVRNQVYARLRRQRAPVWQCSLREIRKRVSCRFHQLRLYSRIFQTHPHVFPTPAASEHHGILGSQFFEVDVPQPRYVVAIGFPVVDEEGHGLGAFVLLDDLEVLVEASRVLRKIEQSAAPL